MAQNVTPLWLELAYTFGGAAVLLVFALSIAVPGHATRRPASRGHRPGGDEGGSERVAPDGFIDSFAGEIEEAGGSLPPALKIALPGVIVWWLVYMIVFWSM